MSYTRLNLVRAIQQKCGDHGYTQDAPTISVASATGGSLSAGTYQVQVAAMGRYGETLPCSVASVVVGASGKITVTIQKDLAPAEYAIYAGTTTGVANVLYQGKLRNWVEDSASTYSITTLATGRTALQYEPTYSETLPWDSFISAAEAAVRKISAVYPQNVSSTYSLSSSAATYALPATWVDGESVAVKIEYPTGEHDPLYMDQGDFFIDEESGYWAFREGEPSSSESARFWYTTPHTLPVASATASTLTTMDRYFDGLAAYGAQCALLELAAKYTALERSEIGADISDRESKGDQFRRLAGAQGSAWRENWGMESGIKAAAVRANWSYYKHRSGSIFY